MINPACPHCGQNHYVIKAGRNRAYTQRYRCQSCQHYFTPDPKPTGYDAETRQWAIRLHLEGYSYRAIGRTLGVNNQSVINWVQAYRAEHGELPLPENNLPMCSQVI